MRASSMGLEVEVKIDKEELKVLGEKGLLGTLKFNDDYTRRKNIPMKICYDKNQKAWLTEWHDPKGDYFGAARRILFFINNEFYENLKEKGSFGDRFLGAGKLKIYVE